MTIYKCLRQVYFFNIILFYPNLNVIHDSFSSLNFLFCIKNQRKKGYMCLSCRNLTLTQALLKTYELFLVGGQFLNYFSVVHWKLKKVRNIAWLIGLFFFLFNLGFYLLELGLFFSFLCILTNHHLFWKNRLDLLNYYRFRLTLLWLLFIALLLNCFFVLFRLLEVFIEVFAFVYSLLFRNPWILVEVWFWFRLKIQSSHSVILILNLYLLYCWFSLEITFTHTIVKEITLKIRVWFELRVWLENFTFFILD